MVLRHAYAPSQSVVSDEVVIPIVTTRRWGSSTRPCSKALSFGTMYIGWIQLEMGGRCKVFDYAMVPGKGRLAAKKGHSLGHASSANFSLISIKLTSVEVSSWLRQRSRDLDTQVLRSWG